MPGSGCGGGVPPPVSDVSQAYLSAAEQVRAALAPEGAVASPLVLWNWEGGAQVSQNARRVLHVEAADETASSVNVYEVALAESRALLVSLLVSLVIAPLAAVIGFAVLAMQLRDLLAARRAQIARQRAMLVGMAQHNERHPGEGLPPSQQPEGVGRESAPKEPPPPMAVVRTRGLLGVYGSRRAAPRPPGGDLAALEARAGCSSIFRRPGSRSRTDRRLAGRSCRSSVSCRRRTTRRRQAAATRRRRRDGRRDGGGKERGWRRGRHDGGGRGGGRRRRRRRRQRASSTRPYRSARSAERDLLSALGCRDRFARRARPRSSVLQADAVHAHG